MKQVVREGKTITVFDDVEEMKWFYHRRLCKDSSDPIAQIMVMDETISSVAKANERLKNCAEPCEVRE